MNAFRSKYRKPAEPLTLERALEKAMKYCAYQERCTAEVEAKLKEWGVDRDDAEAILHRLHDEDFIDNLRYAESIVRGKFNYKRWGRRRIVRALREKRIGPKLIERAMQQIDPKEYQTTIEDLLFKKWFDVERRHPDQSNAERQQKVAFYMQSKGYESDRVWAVLREFRDLE